MTGRYPSLACLALALACAACGETGNAAPQRGGGGLPPMPVKLGTLTPTPVADTTEYLGTLKSRRSITVQPQVDGQLVKIFVKSGDVVEPNTALMQIDPSRQEAAVLSAQATRASRLATLAFAKQ